MVESSLIIGGDRSHITCHIPLYPHSTITSSLYPHYINMIKMVDSLVYQHLMGIYYPNHILFQIYSINIQIQSNLHILNDTIRMGIYIYIIYIYIKYIYNIYNIYIYTYIYIHTYIYIFICDSSISKSLAFSQDSLPPSSFLWFLAVLPCLCWGRCRSRCRRWQMRLTMKWPNTSNR